jgi:hypothetical protein
MTFIDDPGKPSPYILAIALIVITVAVLPSIRRSRDKAFTE